MDAEGSNGKAGGVMSEAADKNAQAMHALFGDAALAHKLNATRIAVITPPDKLTTSGKLVAIALADVLARLWPNIDFSGSGAELQLAGALSATTSGGGTGDGMRIQWLPPYDCIVAIGYDFHEDVGPVLQVGADGWIAAFGPGAHCGSSDNPVGPAFAAAIAGAQVFHRVFESELAGIDAVHMEKCSMDIRTLFDAAYLDVAPLDLAETHVFGVGAVTHGLAWLLEHWPQPVSGQLHLVDQDKYGKSNGQRYAFMRPQDGGVAKVDAVGIRIRAAHPNLVVTPHVSDLNTYCSTRGYENSLHRIIAGLDSAEARRHAALKLPEHAINMWTEGVRIGAGRYLPGNGNACLACDYLENTLIPLDEVAQLFHQTGIRPDHIRSLLDSGRGLNEQEAASIATKWNVQPSQFVGQPLRSVMPALCATGRLQLPNNAEAVDVPFAFASLLAGISGFMMLLKDCLNRTSSSCGWSQHIFKNPTSYMHRLLHARTECVCCTEVKNIRANA